MTVKFGGNPLHLLGNQLKVGDKAPDFNLTDNNLNSVTLADMKGKKLFAVVPSLDTEVCDVEAKKFNEKAASLKDVEVYVISADLPFAQARWCGATNSTNIKTLSDYKDRSFGMNYGAFIKELSLLTRCIIILDENNVVTYVDYLEEITEEPNYENSLSALK